MKGESFSLVPFPGEGFGFVSGISGRLFREGAKLSVVYELRGSLTDLLIPALAARSERRDGLWQQTCFEMFFRRRPAESYWEVNLSPAGHWNLYAFAGYRQGMREERSGNAPAFNRREQAGLLSVSLELDISGIVATDDDLAIALSAVVVSGRSIPFCWALHHPAPKPDFHHPGSFVLNL